MKTPHDTNPPAKLRSSIDVPLRGEADFLDSEHWDGLAARLMVYRLPDWDRPSTPEAMRTWLKRLDMKEADYVALTETSLADFVVLNPAWPLRAWIGLALEIVAERAAK